MNFMNLLALVTDVKDITIFDRPKDWLETHGINILIIVVGAWILRRLLVAILMSFLNRAIRGHRFATETDRKKRINTMDNLLNAVSKIVIWGVVVVMIIDELGINTAPLLASAGVVGLAIGIGAQSLIKDFTNGLFIILENQYRVGDFVQLGTVSGVVQSITIRTTVLKDIDGNIHHVPNSTITVTTNRTFDTSGINEDITVPFDTDLDKLEKDIAKIGEELAADEKYGSKIKRAPFMAQVVQFGDKGIVVKILGETLPGSQWTIRTQLYRRLQPVLFGDKPDKKATK
jgi:small conductance mechanosensitive channel